LRAAKTFTSAASAKTKKYKISKQSEPEHSSSGSTPPRCRKMNFAERTQQPAENNQPSSARTQQNPRPYIGLAPGIMPFWGLGSFGYGETHCPRTRKMIGPASNTRHLPVPEYRTMAFFPNRPVTSSEGRDVHA
jgi:hypothetical protein